jgi:hypothetical protein
VWLVLRSFPFLVEEDDTLSPTPNSLGQRAPAVERRDRQTHLFLLLFEYRGGIRQLRNLLPLLAFLEPLADRREQADERVRHGPLEIPRVHVSLLERLLKRVVCGEVHRPTVLLVPVYAEYRARRGTLGHKRLLLVFAEDFFIRSGSGFRAVAAAGLARSAFEPELRYRDENGLDEGEHAVISDIALLAERLIDLAPNGVGRVEKVDLRVWVGRRHLSPCQAGDHRVHEVCTLRVAKARKVELCESENFPLQNPPPSPRFNNNFT